MEPQSLEIAVPIIDLAGANVQISALPEKPSFKQLVIGPVMLRIVLDEDSRKVIIRGLTGVVLPDTNGGQPK